MTEDLIKRSDALSAAGDMSYIAFEIRKKIRMIPSAEPVTKVVAEVHVDSDEIVERIKEEYDLKEGKWEECQVFDNDDGIIDQWQSARCTECGKIHTTPYMYYFDYFNFCPNCGAKMVKSDE